MTFRNRIVSHVTLRVIPEGNRHYCLAIPLTISVDPPPPPRATKSTVRSIIRFHGFRPARVLTIVWHSFVVSIVDMTIPSIIRCGVWPGGDPFPLSTHFHHNFTLYICESSMICSLLFPTYWASNYPPFPSKLSTILFFFFFQKTFIIVKKKIHYSFYTYQTICIYPTNICTFFPGDLIFFYFIYFWILWKYLFIFEFFIQWLVFFFFYISEINHVHSLSSGWDVLHDVLFFFLVSFFLQLMMLCNLPIFPLSCCFVAHDCNLLYFQGFFYVSS